MVLYDQRVRVTSVEMSSLSSLGSLVGNPSGSARIYLTMSPASFVSLLLFGSLAMV